MSPTTSGAAAEYAATLTSSIPAPCGHSNEFCPRHHRYRIQVTTLSRSDWFKLMAPKTDNSAHFKSRQLPPACHFCIPSVSLTGPVTASKHQVHQGDQEVFNFDLNEPPFYYDSTATKPSYGHRICSNQPLDCTVLSLRDLGAHYHSRRSAFPTMRRYDRSFRRHSTSSYGPIM